MEANHARASDVQYHVHVSVSTSCLIKVSHYLKPESNEIGSYCQIFNFFDHTLSLLNYKYLPSRTGYIFINNMYKRGTLPKIIPILHLQASSADDTRFLAIFFEAMSLDVPMGEA